MDKNTNIAETCGFVPGKLNMICGATGSGKSLYVKNLIKEAMKNGKKVIRVSFDDKDVYSTYELKFPLGTPMLEVSDCVKSIQSKDMIVIEGGSYTPYSKDSDEINKLALHCAKNGISLTLLKQLSISAIENNSDTGIIKTFGSSKMPCLASSIVKVKLNREKTEMTVDVIKNKFSDFLKRVVLKVDLKKSKVEC